MTLFNPSNVVHISWDAISGKLDFDLLDFLDVKLFRIPQFDGEKTVGGRLVVDVGELVVNNALANKFNVWKM